MQCNAIEYNIILWHRSYISNGNNKNEFKIRNSKTEENDICYRIERKMKNEN